MNGNVKVILAVVTAIVLAGCAKDLEKPEALSAQTDNQEEMQSAHFSRRKKFHLFSKGGMIDPTVKTFRELLGPLSLNESMPDGRREILWDDVVLALTNNDIFPGTYYNRTDPGAPYSRKRGAVLTTPGNGFRVSNNNFSDIDSLYQDEFVPYSATKTITTLGSNIIDIDFKVPGTNEQGYVNGFGAVFSDVDRGYSTHVSLFSGKWYLGTYLVKPSNMGKHSFFGVYSRDKKITHVRIKLGSATLKTGRRDVSDMWGTDLVVLDDLIYSNPKKY